MPNYTPKHTYTHTQITSHLKFPFPTNPYYSMLCHAPSKLPRYTYNIKYQPRLYFAQCSTLKQAQLAPSHPIPSHQFPRSFFPSFIPGISIVEYLKKRHSTPLHSIYLLAIHSSHSIPSQLLPSSSMSCWQSAKISFVHSPFNPSPPFHTLFLREKKNTWSSKKTSHRNRRTSPPEQVE